MDAFTVYNKTSKHQKSAQFQDGNLTQQQLDALIGINKSQISKIENNVNSATINTIMKVFKALKAEINFNVKIENKRVEIA